MDTRLGSASQSSATAIEHNDNLSSPQIDKADTNSSFYSTSYEGQVGEATTFIPAPTPFSPFPSRLITEISTEQTYRTQVSVDEQDENRDRLAYSPSDGTDASQLPSLVPVRRRNQSQPIGRTLSATSSLPVAHNSRFPMPPLLQARLHPIPSQYSQGWYCEELLVIFLRHLPEDLVKVGI